MSRRIALISMVLVSMTMSARASKLDQSFVPSAQPSLFSTVGDLGTGQKAEQAQTFTVGIGGRLTQINLDLSGDGTGNGLLLEIRRTTPNGLPSEAPSDLLGAALSSAKGTTDPQLIPFYLGDLAPQVQVGETLALVLKAPGSGTYGWLGAIGDPYPQGNLATRGSYYNNQWTTPVGLNGPDLGFQTYVAPVPEPTTCTFFVVCGLGLLARSRRRGRGISRQAPDR
jgi:hypothetical protein